MTACVEEGAIDAYDFSQVVGRLGFAMGPLEFLRPFIAPLYAWSASVGRKGKIQLPWSIAFIFKFLAEELRGEHRTVEIFAKGAELGVAFMADAKAEGQVVRIGGWECLGGRPTREA
eukprot:8885066-Lingulodinium_polyedra.AAC.1